MNPLRRLLGQTAVYGVSSIIGRVMNFLLTPLYTRVFLRSEYGVITDLYALVAFMIVLLTYGMETAFFRFGSRAESEEEKNRVFSTAFISILATSALFILIVSLNLHPVAELLGYGQYPEFIAYFTWILGLDAIITLPLAALRLKSKPIPFATVQLSGITANIGLNLFFLLYCPAALENPDLPASGLISAYYNPSFGIGYIFLANLLSSILRVLLLIPYMGSIFHGFDAAIYRKLIPYAMPLLILGLAGMVNETFDRLYFNELSGLPLEESMTQLGIYGACYKVAMLLSIGIQAYRFAAEPFVFSLGRGAENDKTQADIMKYYFIVALFITLTILCFMDVALLLIAEEYRVGRGVIPILLLAYLFFGAVFNLSFWYKLNDKTRYGMLIALVGAAVTIVGNIMMVPHIGYYGSAWATLGAYFIMMILSQYLGQKKYPIPYDYKWIALYLTLAGGVYSLHYLLAFEGFAKYLSGTMALVVYAIVVLKKEKILIKKA